MSTMPGQFGLQAPLVAQVAVSRTRRVIPEMERPPADVVGDSVTGEKMLAVAMLIKLKPSLMTPGSGSI